MGVWARSVLAAAGCVLVIGGWCPGVAFGAVGERGFEQVSPRVKGADVEIGGTSRAGELEGLLPTGRLGVLLRALRGCSLTSFVVCGSEQGCGRRWR